MALVPIGAKFIIRIFKSSKESDIQTLLTKILQIVQVTQSRFAHSLEMQKWQEAGRKTNRQQVRCDKGNSESPLARLVSASSAEAFCSLECSFVMSEAE